MTVPALKFEGVRLTGDDAHDFLVATRISRPSKRAKATAIRGIEAARKMLEPGRGHAYRGQVRIVIGWDQETFDQIKASAKREGVSFAEKVRQLAEWGLMDEKDAS